MDIWKPAGIHKQQHETTTMLCLGLCCFFTWISTFCLLDGDPVCGSSEVENKHVAVGAKKLNTLQYVRWVPRGFFFGRVHTFAGYVGLVCDITLYLYKSNKCWIPVLIRKGKGKCVCQLWFPLFFPAAETSCLLLERQDMRRMWWVQLLQSWVQFAIWLFTFLQHAKLLHTPLPPLHPTNFTSVYCCNTLIASLWKSISLCTQHFN